MKRLRVLLVDDSEEFLEVASRFLGDLPSVEVVARARSGEEALRLLAEAPADLVLVDLCMPGMPGIELLRRLRGLPGAPTPVVLTLHDGPEYRAAAAAAGAVAYVRKAEMAERLPVVVEGLLVQGVPP